MHTSRSRLALLVLAGLVLQGCAFHSTAREWNGLVGESGEPTYMKSTTNVGVNLFVVFTVLGSTNVPRMVDELTAEIAAEGGDRVRIIQSESENYWYGFPPLTWFVTPVVTTVAADYAPSEATLADDRESGRGGVYGDHADESDGAVDERPAADEGID